MYRWNVRSSFILLVACISRIVDLQSPFHQRPAYLLKRNLKLIDGGELVDLAYKYYPQLDAKYKGLIPLRQVYIPETLTEYRQ